jgi:uncharacterized YigZ family protein
MSNSYKTVYEGGVGEIIEKKSRFIATVVPVETEVEALKFIEQMKKKYWNASHNCSAYVIGKKDEIQRCNDDGEPSKTAGRPILDVILGEEIHNAAIVITRYFGGTLLGTGGLVRAYQGAAKEGLKNSIIIIKYQGKKIKIITDYNGIGKFQYLAAQMKLAVINTEYTDIVTVFTLVPFDNWDELQKKVIEISNGKAIIEDLADVYFADVLGELMIFN